MGQAYVKKLKENELIGGTDNTDVYPVTTSQAVYSSGNSIYKGANKTLDQVFTEKEQMFNDRNRQVDEKIGEMDEDRELLHRQSEKLVLTTSSSPNSGVVNEIVASTLSIDSACTASLETFGDEPAVIVPTSDYQTEGFLIKNGVAAQVQVTSESSSYMRISEVLPSAIGTTIVRFKVAYNDVTKQTDVNIIQNARKYFGFADSTPQNVESLGTSHFSNSVECTVTIPGVSSGFKKVYFAVPAPMTISRVVQPDALNAPLPIRSAGTATRIIDSLPFIYNVYESVDAIDSLAAKRLTIS